MNETIEPKKLNIYLIRHGETEWSKSGKHTGRTDIELTENGKQQALLLKNQLNHRKFDKVLISPLKRVIETATITGYRDQGELSDDLLEWDYGDFDGRTTTEMRKEIPGWNIFDVHIKNGESIEDVGARADRILKKILEYTGDIALFSSGHYLRVLGARWIGLHPLVARYFALSTASLSLLGYERETPVIQIWNSTQEA